MNTHALHAIHPFDIMFARYPQFSSTRRGLDHQGFYMAEVLLSWSSSKGHPQLKNYAAL